MNRSRHGFILIIVLGLLGVLAFVALDLSSLANTSRLLSMAQTSKFRSRLLARSGIEWAIGKTMQNFVAQGSHTISLGEGSQAPLGDVAHITYKDASGRININDGIRAGRLELGTGYLPNSLDPWPSGPLTAGVQEWSGSNGGMNTDDYRHMNSTSFLLHGEQNADIGPGDTLEVLSGLGQGTYVISGVTLHASGAPPWTFPHELTEITVALDDIVFPPFAWYDVDQSYRITSLPKQAIENISGWINLRVRRLLNAYGDAHRFMASIGVPTPSNYGTPFSFTAKDDSDRGVSLPAGDGLGDAIISLRPALGFGSVSQIRDIANAWAKLHLIPLNSSYLGGKTFFEVCRDDLTVAGYEDDRFFRMTHEWGRYWNDTQRSSYESELNQMMFANLDSSLPPDMSDIWRPHSVACINLSAASDLVRAAAFYAPSNISYLCEADAHIDSINPSIPTEATQLTTAGPVFRPSKMLENGSASNVQQRRLMSMRDALCLARFYGSYADPPCSFNDFERLLMDYTLGGGVLERADPPSSFESNAFTGGFFTQDYLAKTLPHLFNPVRRIPGFLGAPAALLSPYVSTATTVAGSTLKGVSRKVEDFVYRCDTPKAIFTHSGFLAIESEGLVLNRQGDALACTKISATSQLFKARVYRTQEDFESITDDNQADADGIKTSASILIGPEITPRRSGAQAANPHLGFVGLLDSPSVPVLPLPHIAYDFTQNLDPLPGTNPCQDPATDIIATNGNPLASHPLKNSHLEGSAEPFFPSGPNIDTSDLCPFGGVFFGSRKHGYRSGFRDSMYWRFQGVGPHVLLSPTPTGNDVIKGSLEMWYRIPTAPSSLPTKSYLCAIALFQNQGVGINLFHQSEKDLSGTSAYKHSLIAEWNTVALPSAHWSNAIGYLAPTFMAKVPPPFLVLPPPPPPPDIVVTITDAKGFPLLGAYNPDLMAKYNTPPTLRGETWRRFIAYPGATDDVAFWQQVKADGGYAPGSEPDDSESNPDVWYWQFVAGWGGGMDPYGYMSILMDWHAFDVDKGGPEGVTITLPGPPLPPAAPLPPRIFPFTMDGVAYPPFEVGLPVMDAGGNLLNRYQSWTIGGTKRVYQKKLTMKSIPENGPGTWHLATLKWHVPPAQCRWYVYDDVQQYASVIDTCDFKFELGLEDQSNIESQEITLASNSYSGEIHYPWNGVNAQGTMMMMLGEGMAKVNSGPSIPRLRLNSCIDNVRFLMRDWLPSSAPSRYELIPEPAWVIQPSLPENCRIISIGSKIYNPHDQMEGSPAGPNYPRIDFNLWDMGIGSVVIPQILSGNGQTCIFSSGIRFNSSLHRIQFIYKNENPLGNPLINDGTDNWTEIPWIQELSIRYADEPARFVTWEQDLN